MLDEIVSQMFDRIVTSRPKGIDRDSVVIGRDELIALNKDANRDAPRLDEKLP